MARIFGSNWLQLHLLGVEPQLLAEERGDRTDPVDVFAGRGIVQVDRFGEALDRLLARKAQLVDRPQLRRRQLVAQPYLLYGGFD
ncbi:MAG: hypothetical protein H0X42_09335 [Solirubrobacterales bacterium]|nr:hypothetical protein [Solirubrobacterales bacterium]